MMEWLNSIWEWVLINKDNILAFLTSTDFVATITTFIALFKSIKTTKSNTLSITSIKDTIKENQVIKGTVEVVQTTVNEVKGEVLEAIGSVTKCIDKVNNLENFIKQYTEESTTKLNAMLEVQSIVYATIKDDNIRNSVNAILVNAKHSDAASKAKLQSELDAIRAELKAKNEELDATVTKMMEKVSNEVTATPVAEEPKTPITRY